MRLSQIIRQFKEIETEHGDPEVAVSLFINKGERVELRRTWFGDDVLHISQKDKGDE